MFTDDNDGSFSIHDLDHAPAPPEYDNGGSLNRSGHGPFHRGGNGSHGGGVGGGAGGALTSKVSQGARPPRGNASNGNLMYHHHHHHNKHPGPPEAASTPGHVSPYRMHKRTGAGALAAAAASAPLPAVLPLETSPTRTLLQLTMSATSNQLMGDYSEENTAGSGGMASQATPQSPPPPAAPAAAPSGNRGVSFSDVVQYDESGHGDANDDEDDDGCESTSTGMVRSMNSDSRAGSSGESRSHSSSAADNYRSPNKRSMSSSNREREQQQGRPSLSQFLEKPSNLNNSKTHANKLNKSNNSNNINNNNHRAQFRSQRTASESARWSDMDLSSDGDENDDTNTDGDTLTITSMPMVPPGKKDTFGYYRCKAWCVKKIPSCTRISTWVVTRAPCFWWLSRNPTDRAILGRLNVLCGLFASVQIGSLLFLGIVLLAPHIVPGHRTLSGQGLWTETRTQRVGGGIEDLLNIFNINGNVFALGFLGFCVMVTALLTARVIRNVNLVGAMRFLSVLIAVIPCMIFFIIGCFDYFRVTNVWIKHWWRDYTLAWFRHSFCDPPHTANRECTVPQFDIRSNRTQQETEWCLELYNSTDCAYIRDTAQANMDKFMLSFYYLNAGWGLVLLLLLILAVNTLEHIITKPLVQKSREASIPAWLCLPAVACLVTGFLFAFADASVVDMKSKSKGSWVGPVYLVTGILFVLGALLGWYISYVAILSIRAKREKLVVIAAFITTMAIDLILLLTMFAASISLTVYLVKFPVSNQQRGDLACLIDDSGGCTRCEYDDDYRCPEWTVDDVTKILQNQAKASAALSAIALIYTLGALRFGFLMRKHTRMYQIDFV